MMILRIAEYKNWSDAWQVAGTRLTFTAETQRAKRKMNVEHPTSNTEC
jgi:hypothetical protein